jgi:Fibronectin type III domain
VQRQFVRPVTRIGQVVDNRAMSGRSPGTRQRALAVVAASAAAAAIASMAASSALAASPAAPKNFRVSRVAMHSISLAWTDRANNESRYEILRDGSVTKQAPPNSSSFTDSGLFPGTRHSYRVRACNASGCSQFSPARTQAALLLPFGDPYPDIGCSIFPAFNGSPTAPSASNQTAWNQDISEAPVDPRSSKYMAKIHSLGGNQNLHPDFGSNPDYGIPYVVVPGAQPRVPTRFTLYGDESDPGPYPIPPHAPIEAGSDAHVLVIDRGNCTLYETGGSRYVGGAANAWTAFGGALFHLDRAGPLRPDFWTSADAAGLPIFPGLVRFDEVASGHIDHAIRVTFDETRRAFIHPATHYASDSCNVNLPPMGLRMRLKGSYDLSGFSGQALVIARALKQYGVINADNGSNFFITGTTDSRWNDEGLNQLKSIPGSAFQVVKSAASPTVASDC